MKGGCNFPMGPLALLDLVGLDTSVAILDALYDEFRDPNYAAVPAPAPHGGRRPPRPEVRPGLLRLRASAEREPAGSRACSGRPVASRDGLVPPARRRRHVRRAGGGADDRRARPVRAAGPGGPRSPAGAGWPTRSSSWRRGSRCGTSPRCPTTTRGRPDGALAKALVRSAGARAAGIGAATGTAIAAQQLSVATVVLVPFELAAETALAVLTELKLIAELHEVAGPPGHDPHGAAGRGRPATPCRPPRATTRRRAPRSGRAGRRQFVAQLRSRYTRNLATLGPLLTGAAMAGVPQPPRHRLARQRRGPRPRPAPGGDGPGASAHGPDRCPSSRPRPAWAFPPVDNADDSGLVGVGGDLEPGTSSPPTATACSRCRWAAGAARSAGGRPTRGA